jgi:hypothetical protein
VSDTIVADVLDGVYDLFVANSAIAALVTAGTLRTFDGPPAVDWAADSMLVVGGRVQVDDQDSTTEVAWDWATMGVSGAVSEVDETIAIPCGIASKRGSSTTDATMRNVRRSAINIYAACGAALRGSTLSLPRVMWCTSSVSSIQQLQTPDGPECFVDFTAFVRTRI